MREHSEVNSGDSYWFAHEAYERRTLTASEEMRRPKVNLLFPVNDG